MRARCDRVKKHQLTGSKLGFDAAEKLQFKQSVLELGNSEKCLIVSDVRRQLFVGKQPRDINMTQRGKTQEKSTPSILSAPATATAAACGGAGRAEALLPVRRRGCLPRCGL